MMRFKTSKLLSTVVAVMFGVLFGATDASAQGCVDFGSEPLGPRSNPWGLFVGGFPATGQLLLTSANGGLTVEANHATGSRAVRVSGFPSEMKLQAYSNATGGFPTEVELEVTDMNNNAWVYAYDDRGNVLAMAQAPYNQPTRIRFSGLGPIAAVYVFGNQNEMWVDNICIQ